MLKGLPAQNAELGDTIQKLDCKVALLVYLVSRAHTMTKQAKEVQQVVSCVQLASGRRPREIPVVKIVKQVSTRRNQGKVFALRA
mgnify:FL=1